MLASVPAEPVGEPISYDAPEATDAPVAAGAPAVVLVNTTAETQRIAPVATPAAAPATPAG